MSRPTRGTVPAERRADRHHSPGAAIAAGICYVPEDRQEQGAFLPMSIRENITLASIALM